MAPTSSRYLRIAIVALAALAAAAIVMLVIERSEGPGALEISFSDPTPGPGGPIEVYITGAVAEPGVYEMAEGDRVIDLLYKAGGQAPEANLEAINLALRLHDEDQVIVPRQGEPVLSSAGNTSEVLGVTGPQININMASAKELDDALPGIGEVYSQRIVDSRTWDGLFVSPDDLVTRRLIPRSTFEDIEPLITTGP